MEIALISFSPTGGTLKCARLVAEGMGRIIKEIDLTDSAFEEAHISSSTTALFAFPSYAGRLPLPLRERLGRIKGDDGDAVLVAVYGNRDIDDTLIEGADIVSENGFRIKACVSAVAEHSLVRTYGKGRPDEKDARVLNTCLNKTCGARGGGSPAMVQGSLKCPEDEIRRALEDALTHCTDIPASGS